MKLLQCVKCGKQSYNFNAVEHEWFYGEEETDIEKVPVICPECSPDNITHGVA